MMKVTLRVLTGAAIIAITVWCVGVLYFSPLLPESWRTFGAGGYAALTIMAFLFLPHRGRTVLGALAAFGILVFLQKAHSS